MIRTFGAYRCFATIMIRYCSLRTIRKTALSVLSAASQLFFAHEMALPSYIHACRFSCKHVDSLALIISLFTTDLHYRFLLLPHSFPEW